MPKIKINKERCKGCNLCIIFCPLGHIKPDKDLNKAGLRPVIFCLDKKKGKDCTGCSMCALICPDAAIEVLK